MNATDDLWIPLVDEPIGLIVEAVYTGDPELAELVGTPRRILAFRTFAYIRVGLLLGQLLLENDVPEFDHTDNWVEALLEDPRHRASVAAAVRGVAEEVAREPDPESVPIGPDDEARKRFREFARKQLG